MRLRLSLKVIYYVFSICNDYLLSLYLNDKVYCHVSDCILLITYILYLNTIENIFKS